MRMAHNATMNTSLRMRARRLLPSGSSLSDLYYRLPAGADRRKSIEPVPPPSGGSRPAQVDRTRTTAFRRSRDRLKPIVPPRTAAFRRSRDRLKPIVPPRTAAFRREPTAQAGRTRTTAFRREPTAQAGRTRPLPSGGSRPAQAGRTRPPSSGRSRPAEAGRTRTAAFRRSSDMRRALLRMRFFG